MIGADVNIEGSIFRNNTAFSDGGALSVYGNLKMAHCRLLENLSVNGVCTLGYSINLKTSVAASQS